MSTNRLNLIRAVSQLATNLLIFLILGYQMCIRPLLIGTCKFCPSCSEYSIEALRMHGLWRGLKLGLARIVRCHPFSHGGIDPVPENNR